MGVKRDKLGPKFHPEKRGETCDIDDWFISGLPDGVLIMILSLLPLREAVRTSVLSSRWTNLWRHSLRLNFVADEALHDRLSYNEEGHKYINWVNSVVQSHKAPKLEEFRVYFHLDKSFEEAITTWLEFAFARRVQELELSLLHNCDFHRSNSNHARYDFPDELLGRKSGRKAPLDRFKSLKDLCLRAVNVSGEHIGFFIGNCPFLERLIVQGSRIMSKVEVCGTSLELKHLEIFDCHPSGLPIKISAPNLTSLKVEKLSGLLLENVPMLVEFNLTRGYSDLYDHKLLHVLHCCIYQLDILTVDLVYFKKLEYCVFPQMPKLKKLKIIKYALPSHEKLVVFMARLVGGNGSG